MPFIRDVAAEITEVPLRHVFATAKDKLARQISRPVVIAIRMEDGRAAAGEAVPVAYVTGETPESVVEVVRAARLILLGADVRRLRRIIDALRQEFPDSPTAIAGIETALYNALARFTGLSLAHLLGGAIDEVETDITLPIVADAADRAREAAAMGFRRFKIKVGSADPEEDFSRLLGIQAAVPHGKFRLDANQAFSAEEALAFINRTLAAGVQLELVEQPTPKEDLAALDRVAAASPVPIFADESVKSPADALRLVRETRVQGINIKVMKSGISGALDIIAIARAASRKLMLGCMLETRRGISHSLALACGTGAFDYIDLDSHMLLLEEGENVFFEEDGPILRLRESD